MMGTIPCWRDGPVSGHSRQVRARHAANVAADIQATSKLHVALHRRMTAPSPLGLMLCGAGRRIKRRKASFIYFQKLIAKFT
jgi:hypothetical protein